MLSKKEKYKVIWSDGVIMEKKKIFIIVENHELLEGIAQQFEKFSNYQIVLLLEGASLKDIPSGVRES